jgi:hypothetical protein
MSDPKPETGSPILDKAIVSLQNSTADAGGPTDFLMRRTSAALWAEQVRAAQTRGRWAMRIAAVIVLGVCAAATVVVLYQRSQIAKSAPQNQTHVPEDKSNGNPAIIPVVDLTAPEAPAQPPVSVAEVILTGHVYIEGRIPARRQIDIRAYPQAIASTPGPIFDDSVVVNRDGTLANVVISITGPLPADHVYPNPPPVVMDQRYCTFKPRVVAAVIGQQLILRNSDNFPHLSHALNSATAIGFNSPVPGNAVRNVEPFPASDTFEVRSDLFPWMHGYVRVLDNPFFDVTRSDGAYSVKDLPPGHYTLHAWHEVLGELEKEIEVTGGEPAVVDFTFDVK